MRLADIVSGLVMIALAAFVIWATSALAYWQRLVPGPGFMPYWVSITGVGLGLLVIALAVLRPVPGKVGWPEPRAALRIIACFLALCLVPITSPYIGFLTAAVIFMLFALIVVSRKAVLPSLITTAVIAAMVHFLFNTWLNVRLPSGPFGF